MVHDETCCGPVQVQLAHNSWGKLPLLVLMHSWRLLLLLPSPNSRDKYSQARKVPACKRHSCHSW